MPDDHKYDEINPPPHTSIPVNGAEPYIPDDPMAIPAYQPPPTDRPVEPPPVPARSPGIDRTTALIEQLADSARAEVSAAHRNRMAFMCAIIGVGASINYLSHAFAELRPDDVARYPKLIEQLRDNLETLRGRIDALTGESVKQAAE